MSSIYGSRFNWVSTPSAWDSIQNWRAKSAEHRANFEATMSDAVYSFSDAATSQFSGMATIAGQVALKRITDAAKAKVLANQAALDKLA